MTPSNENTGTMKFEKPVETKREIEVGDSIYNTSGKFLAVCIKREGAYVYHRTMNGTEGNNYEHYYVRIESMLKENQELKALLKSFVERMNQVRPDVDFEAWDFYNKVKSILK